MNSYPAYRILPLGDAAVLVDCGNTISDAVSHAITGWFRRLQADPLPGMIEAVPAYSSLAVHYDPGAVYKLAPAGQTAYAWMKQQVEKRMAATMTGEKEAPRLVQVPVCYEEPFAPDIEDLAATNGLSVEELIRMHTSVPYRVYMLGFLPGFAYMGPVDERLRAPRKASPAQVAAGSVGIAGNQTGIYPLSSPGGWCIIGRTPLRLFDAANETPVLLQAGDQVQFYSISRHEFENY
ncbi:MAG: 5-oxoprolinase subunit PxpB [Chitinophagaceae bacterium]